MSLKNKTMCMKMLDNNLFMTKLNDRDLKILKAYCKGDKIDKIAIDNYLSRGQIFNKLSMFRKMYLMYVGENNV